MRDILTSVGDCASKPFKLTPLDFIKPDPDPYELLDPAMWAMAYLFNLGADPKHGPITTFKNTSRSMCRRNVRPVDFLVLTAGSRYG